MQKATNINKLYNYWTDFERIYLSKIYEILSCRKNIFISNLHAFNIRRKTIHVLFTCKYQKVLSYNKYRYYWEMKNNLAQFTVL